MNKNPYYPTDLTAEEAASGFIVVQQKISPSDSGTAIAIMPITESGRLTKVHDLVSNSNGYGFQVFCKSTDPLVARYATPEWKDLHPTTYSSIAEARLGLDNYTIESDLWLEITVPSQVNK